MRHAIIFTLQTVTEYVPEQETFLTLDTQLHKGRATF